MKERMRGTHPPRPYATTIRGGQVNKQSERGIRGAWFHISLYPLVSAQNNPRCNRRLVLRVESLCADLARELPQFRLALFLETCLRIIISQFSSQVKLTHVVNFFLGPQPLDFSVLVLEHLRRLERMRTRRLTRILRSLHIIDAQKTDKRTAKKADIPANPSVPYRTAPSPP